MTETKTYPDMQAVALPWDHPDVVRLNAAYRARYGLGAPEADYGKDRVWTGVQCDGAIVCVFSERGYEEGGDRILTISDAYCDPTENGWLALMAGVLRYYEMVKTGKVTAIRHTVLFQNQRFWKWIAELTGDEPVALLFEHRHKGG